MASSVNFGDACSLTLAYDFELGSKVKLDGRGQETVLKKVAPLVMCMRYCLMELSA